MAIWKRTVEQVVDKRFDRALLAFAPSFTQNQALIAERSGPSALKFNQQEVERIHQYLSGKLIKGSDANESTFYQLAPQSQLLHLATHGIANDDDPLQSGLYFSTEKDTLEDGFLSALEIYGMQLDADLAVISACNTGYGKLAAGEGVMSLGRAFSYAGCKSILMSLWLANDQSTAQLMDRFYYYLKKGQSKEKALRQAKLDYLTEANMINAHPYFWAGIIAVGDMSPIRLQSGVFNWKWGMLVFVGLLFCMFLNYLWIPKNA